MTAIVLIAIGAGVLLGGAALIIVDNKLKKQPKEKIVWKRISK